MRAAPPPSTGHWDVFISHAGEDKEGFVRPLAATLRARGLSTSVSGARSTRTPSARALSHSAAQWLAPFGRSATHTLYADEPGTEALKEALKLTHAARGPNVVLLTPTDESLFHDASEPAPKVFCTSPIVTYLDLWAGSDRDREAAEHLAGEFFPWLK